MKVLVIGATGHQGGHVARLLLKKGHTVHAFTRNPSSPAAQELVKLGALAVLGDLQDRGSLEHALDSIDAVFGMATPFREGTEPNIDQEIKEGVILAESAKAKKKYLVYSSVAAANKSTGIPHFDSKQKIEQNIVKIGGDAAIIAPAYFMENLITYQLPVLRENLYSFPLEANRKLAQIALADLAAFAILALENKQKFIGKRIDLASENLTGEEAAAILTRVTGRPIKFLKIPIESVRKVSMDMAKMYEWFDHVGFTIDTTALRKQYPEIKWHSFEAWAKEQDWSSILRDCR